MRTDARAGPTIAAMTGVGYGGNVRNLYRNGDDAWLSR